MDELVDEIAKSCGLDSAVAHKAVGIIANFIAQEAPPATVNALFDKLPGARALAEEHGAATGGLLGVFNDLTGAGLGMAEIQGVTMAFVALAKKRAGDATVDAVISAIPGLAQFV